MTYRVYYNNRADPQRWSIDEGDASSEITVREVRLNDVLAQSQTRDTGPQPRAWFIVIGTLTLVAGVAIFQR